MKKQQSGDWEISIEGLGVGTLYGYRLTGPLNEPDVIVADPYSKSAVTQNNFRHAAKSLIIDESSSIIASKPRAGLRTRPSEANNLQEADFDVKTRLAPPKSAENDEKPIRNQIFCEKKKIRKIFFENFFSASKNQKFQIVRNACCRSFAPIRAMFARFVAASAGFAKRKRFKDHVR